MKTALIIPVHNQNQYLSGLITAIEHFSEKPYCVYIMLDREKMINYYNAKKLCSDTKLVNKYKVYNETEIPIFIGHPVNQVDADLFLTGDRRNRAIEYAINDGCDCFVFIDGDCVPQEDLIKSRQSLHAMSIPIITCGRRREAKYDYKDQREVVDNLKYCNFFKLNEPQLINDYDLLKSSAVVWSCNLGLNLPAVLLLKAVNLRYYGRNEVFNSNFLGSWGGEDSFLGMQSYLLGIKIFLLSDMKSGIKHIEHNRPTDKYNPDVFNGYLYDQINLFKFKLINDPLSVDFICC